MSILDRLPSRQAARRMEDLAREVASVRALSETRLRTVERLKSKLDEANMSQDQQRGMSGNFVGGKWDDVNGPANTQANMITAARQGYAGTWKDNAGVTRPFGTSRRIVDMHAEYCFGPGLECPTIAPKEGDREAEAIEQAIRDWWLYPPNQETAFDMDSQHRLSAKLLVDGWLYFACFAPTAGRPMLLRLLDPLQMGSPVTSPDDASKVLYHTRRWAQSRWDVKSGTYVTAGAPKLLYYPDVDLDSSDDIENPYADDPDLQQALATDKQGNPTRVLKVGDGYSIMLAMMLWEKEFNDLAESQVTISRASAAYMMTLVVEGGQTEVDGAVAHFGQSGDDPTTAPPNPGDMNVMNQAAELKISRASVGQYEADRTRRMLQQPQVAAGGVSLHYIGDPENANLATATAMEGPQLKHFQAHQGKWTNIYTKLLKEALREQVDDTQDLTVFVPMPSLVEPDLMDRVDALKVAREQGWATKKQAAREYWKAMGAADPTAEVEVAMEEEPEEPEVPEAPEGQPLLPQPPLPTEGAGAYPFPAQ